MVMKDLGKIQSSFLKDQGSTYYKFSERSREYILRLCLCVRGML